MLNAKLIPSLQKAFRNGNYDLAICISKGTDMVYMVDNFNHYTHLEVSNDYDNFMIDEISERLSALLEFHDYATILTKQGSHNIDPKLKTFAYYYTLNFSWYIVGSNYAEH